MSGFLFVIFRFSLTEDDNYMYSGFVLAQCVCQSLQSLKTLSCSAVRVTMAGIFVSVAMLGLTACRTSWSTSASTRALTSTSSALVSVRVCVCEGCVRGGG